MDLVCHVISQDHFAKLGVILWVEGAHGKSPASQIWLL